MTPLFLFKAIKDYHVLTRHHFDLLCLLFHFSTLLLFPGTVLLALLAARWLSQDPDNWGYFSTEETVLIFSDFPSSKAGQYLQLLMCSQSMLSTGASPWNIQDPFLSPHSCFLVPCPYWILDLTHLGFANSPSFLLWPFWVLVLAMGLLVDDIQFLGQAAWGWVPHKESFELPKDFSPCLGSRGEVMRCLNAKSEALGKATKPMSGCIIPTATEDSSN